MEPAAADAAGANDANGGVPYPCCRIETTDGLWAGEAVEKAAYHMCCAYGAVIDARCAEDGAVLVYFAAEGTAVEAARRLVGRELGEFYIEDTSTNVANVEVTISGLGAGEKGAQLEADVAGECGKYGRVLDVFCDGSVVRVAFASVSGAAAAVIALDGAALDGARVAAALGTDMAMEPSAVLRNVATEEFTAADLHVECAQFGRVKAVRAILAEGDCFTVAFDEARAAAACAAALDGRKYAGKAVAATFRVRGAEDEPEAAPNSENAKQGVAVKEAR